MSVDKQLRMQVDSATMEELEAMRKKKADERGEFSDKIFLEYVE